MTPTVFSYSMKYFPREHRAFNVMKQAALKNTRINYMLDEKWSGRHSTDYEPPFFNFMRYLGPAPGGDKVKVSRVDRNQGFIRGNVTWEVRDPGSYVPLRFYEPMATRSGLPSKLVEIKPPHSVTGVDPFPLVVDVSMPDGTTDRRTYLSSGYFDPRCVETPDDLLNVG